MQPLSSSNCLDVWERGQSLHPLDRGLLALSFALPEQPPESLADWPLGRRNQALLELQSCCFGSRLEAWTSCTGCGEKMELTLDAMDFLAQREDHAAAPVIVRDRAFRLPSSRDLASIVRENDPGTAAQRLIERCLLSEPSGLPELLNLREEIEEALAVADPLAEIRLALGCPACGRTWEEPLDVTSFVWAEIDARARQLLGQVHTLASAYGWTEADILSLSEARRGLYLGLVEQVSERRSRRVNREAAPEMASEMLPEALFF